MNKNNDRLRVCNRILKRTTIGTAAYFLLGISAYAAEPVWGGFYVGGNLGIGASQITASAAPFAGSADLSAAGLAAGAQIGVNWHIAPHWVAGFEGDIGHFGISREYQDFNDPVVFGVTTDWYATLRGRLAYTTGPSLLFFTGGAAYVGVTNRFDEIVNGVFSSRSGTTAGWVVGGGVETLLGGNWSAKAEYLYIDAGSRFVFNAEVLDGVGSTARINHQFHVFRYGVNYRFGGEAKTGTFPAHDWQGFYVGIHAGVSLSEVHIGQLPNPYSADLAGAGFTGGLQAGYNFRLNGNLIAGVEADLGHLGIDHSPLNWNGPFEFGVKASWYATVRGRFGYDTGTALLYVTGGAAIVELNNSAKSAAILQTNSTTSVGWTFGGGIETALGGNWTAKTEYLFIETGSQNLSPPAAGPLLTFDNGFHVFRFGLNRKFGS